ncbi:MAG: transcriptional regulator [Geobacter sp.]|nr:MAG: transcriptional regulator [Geobacter sp.]
MITKKTKYAFKALIHLAGTPSGHPVLIADLAESENIPKKFLEFILLSLRKGGLLNSRVGKGGGYSLALPADKISVGSIIRILEGDFAPVQCLSTTNRTRCEECKDEETCGIRLTMADVHAVLTTTLGNLTLADMIERSEQARKKLRNVVDYCI